MSVVVGFNEIKPENVDKPRNNVAPGSPGATSTEFFRAPANTPVAPTAVMNRYPAGKARYSSAHFHAQDQFQVFVEGSGTFGRRRVAAYDVHFTRAYTRYGPLLSDDCGWAFIVLRSRRDSGAQRGPEALEKQSVPGRKPWQVTAKVSFPPAGQGVSVRDVPEIKDDQGLFTSTMTMAPLTKTTAPDPSKGDGQYVVVVKGSLMHEGKERQAPAVIFIKPDENAFEMHAGAQGLEAIIMNFPMVTPRKAEARKPSAVAGLKVWQCQLCSFTYDEALGMPEEGVAAGTRWEDVPDTWSCPDCSANKSDFIMAEI